MVQFSSSAPRRKIHFVLKSRDHLELQNDLMEGLYDIRSIIDENKNANEAANSAIRYLGPSQQ